MKIFYFLFCGIILYSCSVGMIKEDSISSSIGLATKSENKPSYEEAYFHKSTNSWIIPQEDPYRIDFINNTIRDKADIQKMINNHCFELEATDYALTVFPRNVKELQEIEGLPDIQISYIPFACHKLSTNVLDSRNKDTIEKRIFYEEERYIEEQPIYNSEGNLVSTEIIKMPILYVVWPKSKPLPNKLDYSIDYEVFIPNHYSLYHKNKDLIDIIEQESLFAVLNSPKSTRSNRLFTGYLYYYDYLLPEGAPVANLKIRFRVGSNISDITTTSSGYFAVTTNSSCSVEAVFQDSRWKITSSSSTSPITLTIPEISSSWVNGNSITLDNDLVTSHLALNAYYYLPHPIPVLYETNGIRIKLINSYIDHCGEFHPGLLGSSNIDLYYGIYHERDLISLVCHELGHYNHYLVRNGFFPYTSVHRLFKESYADYSGWFITRFFYKYYNPSISDTTLSIMLSRSNQVWTMNDTGDNSHYSPLFVDLIDDDNQAYYNVNYNYDPISSVPHFVINEMIGNRVWSEYKSTLSNYIGTYFNSSDYSSFVAPYDYYFTHD